MTSAGHSRRGERSSGSPAGSLVTPLVWMTVAFVLLKLLQVYLYPHPYLVGDSEEYVLSAESLKANPYKPIGYSLYLAATRVFSPTPTVSVVLAALLRLIASLGLTWVLHRHQRVRREVAVAAGALIAFDPHAWYLDHFLIADTVYTAQTIGFLATILAYVDSPTRRWFAGALALSVSTMFLRFVGLANPALLAATVVWRAPSHASRARRAGMVVLVSSASILAISAHVDWSLGRFRPTTFDGWALYGNIAPHLDELAPEDFLDPEARLVAEFLTAYPSSIRPDHDSNWHRWNRRSPAKRLLRAFWPRYEPEPKDVEPYRRFLTGFIREAKVPTTPAQRYFVEHRNRTNPALPAFALQYRNAFILVNELFRSFTHEWIAQNLGTYLRTFVLPSFARVFVPTSPVAHGRYTYREHPDGSITAFWPGQHTTEWTPRHGDPMAALRKLYAPWAMVSWAVAAVILCAAFTRPAGPDARRARRIAILIFAFAIACGFAVAWSHLVLRRYVMPLLPFVWTAAALAFSARSADPD